MKNAKVYIIILNYNGFNDTIECLQSIFELKYSSFSIILVDNFSTDDSVVHLTSWLSKSYSKEVFKSNEKIVSYKAINLLPEITFISAQKNTGYSGGNNLGLKYCLEQGDFDFVWILNNDTVVRPDTLANLALKAEFYHNQGRKVGIIGSKVLYYQTNIIQCAGGCNFSHFKTSPEGLGNGQIDSSKYDVDTNDFSYILGASMFVSADFLKDAGLLCEDYFLYFEEIDWICKARQIQNWELGYAFNSIVFHKEGQSTKSDKNMISPFADFHYFSSRILFTKKYFKRYLIMAYYLLLLNIVKRSLKGQYRNVWSLFKVFLMPK